MSRPCPLCQSDETSDFHLDQRRSYLACGRCRLVFVPEEFHVSPDEEKRIYDLHENDPDDPGYRRFLSRLVDPLLERIDGGSRGLDFGCGPGPALAAMLEEAGHGMSLYDPFFADNPQALETRYDFICATEVFEHLRYPGFEIPRLVRLLKPGGILAVMTKLVRDHEAFSRWHYIRDETHISFFSRETFVWLAGRHGCGLTFIGGDVIFLQS